MNARQARGRSGHVRRWRVALLLGLAAFLLATAALTAVVRDEPKAPSTHEVRSPETPQFSPDLTNGHRYIARSSRPRDFAIAVARALFDWDTTGSETLSDLTERLLKVTDPTGVETPGLVNDIANFLPTDQTWEELRTYSTRQRLQIEAAAQPHRWEEAVGQAGGRIADGTSAVTIRGVRHRSGVWESRSASSKHPVAFTVFVICRPSYPTCHLLRLSLPDHPLE